MSLRVSFRYTPLTPPHISLLGCLCSPLGPPNHKLLAVCHGPLSSCLSSSLFSFYRSSSADTFHIFALAPTSLRFSLFTRFTSLHSLHIASRSISGITSPQLLSFDLPCWAPLVFSDFCHRSPDLFFSSSARACCAYYPLCRFVFLLAFPCFSHSTLVLVHSHQTKVVHSLALDFPALFTFSFR